MLKEEYSDFLEWTSLHDMRPDERIEFSELGGYLELVRHINAHHFYLGQEQQRDINARRGGGALVRRGVHADRAGDPRSAGAA